MSRLCSPTVAVALPFHALCGQQEANQQESYYDHRCRPKRFIGRPEFLTSVDYERALVGTAILMESETALFTACML